MAKAGQHHNDDVNRAKPRSHERSRGTNHPDRAQPVTTGTSKKPETYAEQARAHSGNTADHDHVKTNRAFDALGLDVREHPDTTTGGPRARDSDLGHGRSGSDSNAS